MTEQILDFKASEPANGPIAPIPIPVAPVAPVPLADLGIFLSVSPPAPASNRVELVATVGVQALTGTLRIQFRILRDGSEIFNTVQGVESAFESFWTVTFETVDFYVPLGFHTYTVNAQLITGGTAQVVGPITFSGLAVGPID